MLLNLEMPPQGPSVVTALALGFGKEVSNETTVVDTAASVAEQVLAATGV